MPIEIFPDDIFLVSYPKSGRTWLRFLIGNYLSNNQWDFPNSYRSIVTDVDFNLQQCCQSQHPRFITSHMPFTPDYKKVVYIVRDGRDVAVSYYFHMLKFKLISKETQFKDFISNFNYGSLNHLTTWSSHVNIWLDNAPDDFLLVKYEDLKANAFTELFRILEFAGLSVNQDTVMAAVKASKFENLQSYERLQEKILFEDIANSDLSIPFFRKGQVGDYKNFFSDELIKDFIEIHGSALERLGYLTADVFGSFEGKKIRDLEARLRQFELELKKSQAYQHRLELQLEEAQIEQSQSRLELEQSKATIAEMESSKFWKLRLQWFEVKKQFKAVFLGIDRH